MPRTAEIHKHLTIMPVSLWRALLIFSLFIVAVFLTGSLLAYPLYRGLALLVTSDFHKVVHYSILLTGLGLGLYYLHATNQLANMLGHGEHVSGNLRRLALGYAGGVAILLLVEGSLALLGMRQPDLDLSNGLAALLLAVLKALFTGLTVGLTEEILYRGAIFTGLARYTNQLTALIISACLYGAVHFIEIAALPSGTALTWSSGLTLLAGAFTQFTDPLILDSLLSLTLLGVLLGLLRRHEGNIILCVGVHAGIVTINKIFAYATDYQRGSHSAFLVNAYDHQTGLLATVWLALACALYYLLVMRRAIRQATSY
ncbi:MAG: hypothetical protein HW386_1684 [Gammaproteobacteria bacterium]|nr:hypothetical protein [Gammaproteobacteria bacterium]